MVVQDIPVNKQSIPAGVDLASYFCDQGDGPHISLGGGFHIAYNENFILTAEVGFAPDNRDGRYGIYIGFGYLF
jgi:hypothetical protein